MGLFNLAEFQIKEFADVFFVSCKRLSLISWLLLLHKFCLHRGNVPVEIEKRLSEIHLSFYLLLDTRLENFQPVTLGKHGLNCYRLDFAEDDH